MREKKGALMSEKLLSQIMSLMILTVGFIVIVGITLLAICK